MSDSEFQAIKARIPRLDALYALLFLASLAMIVEHTSTLIWALTLGSAVLVRITLVQPTKQKYGEELLRRNQAQASVLGQ